LLARGNQAEETEGGETMKETSWDGVKSLDSIDQPVQSAAKAGILARARAFLAATTDPKWWKVEADFWKEKSRKTFYGKW
jgi:hypothetical protein